ncbi:formylglycine-generating enzyme family protein [Methylomonas sp. MS20]|uniref:formylglycine-generating enzyme family protein n=1 Tax=unclassified Methylomonas TaxID=2608980 RepID=UPI0028A3F864|nr:formylglycine-generating enzyme family protein [Methylomonas sp. MV1]MDT4331338.1 formylglycine-generating enzyme family protein [Methylomonas sp. MV1]
MTPPRRGLLSRADLLDALIAQPQAAGADPASAVAYLAGQLRLEWKAPKSQRTEPESARPAPAGVPLSDSGAAADTPREPLRDALFWYLAGYESLGEPESAEAVPLTHPTADTEVWRNRPRAAPGVQPLATWAELAPRLRQVLGDYREGRGIDLAKTLTLIGQGQVLPAFPRERRRRWGPSLLLIEDDSRRLIPYRADKRLIRDAIGRLLPEHALARALMDDQTELPLPLTANAEVWPPPPGSLVLVLGDLGGLALRDAGLRQRWLALGTALREAGCHPLVLFPAPPMRCPPALAAVWRVIAWERPRLADDGRSPAERAERLLRLVSPAARIEPGLLRAARLLLPPEAADAGTEADVWQHPALIGDSAAGATLDPAEAKRLRAELADTEPAALRHRLLRAIKAWRGDLPPEIWFDELLNVDPAAVAADPREPADQDLRDDLDDARRYFADFCALNPARELDGMPGHDRAWLARIAARATRHLCADGEFGVRLAELLLDASGQLPEGIQPRDIPPPDRPERQVDLIQSGSNLQLLEADAAERAAGSWLAHLTTANGLVQFEPLADAGRPRLLRLEGTEPVAIALPPAGALRIVSDRARLTFQQTAKPSWASAIGRDRHGLWAEFTVEDSPDQPTVQRMRWIPPGSFGMGSPDDEAGRFNDEGPRHTVTLRDGYWLFDTPCTQALWQAVMGDNPSRFQSPRRPVEQVSWNDVQAFIQRLNARIPGLALELPSEALWEYACRAGTDSALYSGPIDILGERNAPALDAIAWYGGNSGEGFELTDGFDTSDWLEMQYPNRQAGSRLVKGKLANPWGLYDMLGNVWEWVQDDWHPNYHSAPADGGARMAGETGAARVVRGGSWYNLAWYCRCACRSNFQPDYRNGGLGFRCARVQA